MQMHANNIIWIARFSNHFDNTRHFVWPSVKEFLEGLSKYTLIADIGCGNGKNMCHLNNDYLFIDDTGEL